jgi:mevalonate kinase
MIVPTSRGGFGKIILFGEHFVVHGLPALIGSIDNATQASITITSHIQSRIIDMRPKVPTYKPTKKEAYDLMLYNILSHLSISHSVDVTLHGDLMVTSGGIGASAAASIAITQALNTTFNLKLNKEQIYTAAFMGEKAIHGNPSGIDVAASLWGGLMTFRKIDAHTFDRKEITLSTPLYLVIADSGKPADTKTSITATEYLKKVKPSFVANLFDMYKNVFAQAKEALEQHNLKRLGMLMGHNQDLLEKFGVSSDSNNRMIAIALQAGALGAKITGSGNGGIIVALAKNEHHAITIQETFFTSGFYAMATSIQAQTHHQHTTKQEQI